MKTVAVRRRLCVGTVVAVLVAGGLVGSADDFKPESGYTSLFNGKDLSGWYYRIGKGEKEPLEGKTETSDRRFQVVDGVIVANARDASGKGGIKDLSTVQEYGQDFHLKLEFRAAEKADSGVYIRGPQLQVRDFIRRGEQKQFKKFKNDDWNELDITVKGTEASCLVNGELLRKMKVPVKGPIGLQAETGKFEFRHICIRAES